MFIWCLFFHGTSFCHYTNTFATNVTTFLKSDNLLMTLMRTSQTARLATVTISHKNMGICLQLWDQARNVGRQYQNIDVGDAHQNHHAQVVIRVEINFAYQSIGRIALHPLWYLCI